jgi:ubiquinone/menaquinone biosynthesis C-methylase UbiE
MLEILKNKIEESKILDVCVGTYTQLENMKTVLVFDLFEKMIKLKRKEYKDSFNL